MTDIVRRSPNLRVILRVIYALHHPIRMELYLSQIVFMLFVAVTVRPAWRGAANRRVVPRLTD